MKLEFSRQIFEKCLEGFTKILQVGAELFQGDGRTDGHVEASSRFS